MNYSKLVAAIDDRIKANGRREITGQTLHDVLEAMVRSLGAGYQVAGVLGVDDDPGEPDQRFAFLAAEPGVYRNCGGLAVTELSWLIWGGGEWILKPMDVPFGVTVQEWIRDAVAEERSRALIAEALLQKNIDTEAATREAEDTALGGRIDKEISDREAAVAAEADARDKADKALQAAIDAEATERKDADAAEAKARTDADAALGVRIDTETAERKQADADEKAAREAADATLQGNIDKEQERAEGAESALRSGLAQEVSDRKEAVAAEASARDAADVALGGRIDTETSERKAADASEADTRDKADKALQANIDAEEAARTAADTKEAEDRAAAVKAEADARTAADTALGTRIDTETTERKAADTALGGRIDTEITDRKTADTALDTRVTAIEGKIPATASASNKLADTEFVNSSIATATATFRGTFDTLETLKATEADKNDYAFYVHKDEAGNTCYDKYTYDGAEWKFEYRLNNSSFTAAQWAAINSGITAEVIAALQEADKTNAAAIAKEVQDREAAVAAEETARQDADTALGERIDTKQATLVSGTNIKTVNGNSLLGEGDIEIKAGSEPLIVTMTRRASDATFRDTDKTSAEIAAAFNAGQVVLVYDTMNDNEGALWRGLVVAINNGIICGNYRGTVRYQMLAGTLCIRLEETSVLTASIDTAMPTAPTDTNVPSTKLLKSYVEANAGESAFTLTLTKGTDDEYTMDRTWDELAAAVDAKTPVLFTMSGGSYSGDTFTATVMQHNSSVNLIILQGYVNSLYLYVVMTLNSGTVTISVSEISLVNIDTSIPTAPTNSNVPGTKAIKDYVDGLVADLQAQIDELKFGNVLTFTVQEGGTINWKSSTADIAKTIQYSKNGDAWTNITSTIDGATIDVVAGDILRFKGYNETYAESRGDYTFFGGTAIFAASGNIMSLVDGDNFDTLKTVSDYAFAQLFYGCTGLTSAPELPATTLANSCYTYMFRGCTGLTSAPELPATTLANSCYYSMFSGCTGLTQAPELPATTLANSCYYNMFYGCTGLTSAPELPATTLASTCYYNMFYGCTGLTSAPELPATTLANSCYSYMFYGCTGLTSAPELPATTLAGYCYSDMFYGCTGLTQAPELPATTLAGYCYSDMFRGCTGLTQAPELPATTLAGYCYSHMFYGCTGLTSAPELPATTLANSCYFDMFRGCTGLTQAPELPATTLANSCYYFMFYGCTGLTSAPELPATTLASTCYYNMFYGCTGLTSAPELPATTLANSCYSYMFYGCTGLTSAPELPATTLAGYCYYNMFGGCAKLAKVTCLATDISASNCVASWLSGVAASGTFVKAAAMTSWPSGSSGIPEGWTVEDAA